LNKLSKIFRSLSNPEKILWAFRVDARTEIRGVMAEVKQGFAVCVDCTIDGYRAMVFSPTGPDGRTAFMPEDEAREALDGMKETFLELIEDDVFLNKLKLEALGELYLRSTGQKY